MVLEDAAHAPFLEQVQSWVEEITPTVHWHSPVPGLPIFSAITPEWLRLDLTVTIPALIMGTQDSLKPLFDKAALHAGLPSAPPPRALDGGKLSTMAHEFIRVMGLLPVVLRRHDYIAAATGMGLTRTMLIDLLLEEKCLPVPPGALSTSSVLSAEDKTLLLGMPRPGTDAASLIACQRALTDAFVPKAKALLAEAGQDWPEEFYAATQTHLAKTLAD